MHALFSTNCRWLADDQLRQHTAENALTCKFIKVIELKNFVMAPINLKTAITTVTLHVLLLYYLIVYVHVDLCLHLHVSSLLELEQLHAQHLQGH